MTTAHASVIYENTVPATFVRRLNRFTAEVEVNGTVEKVHVKNTGRLGELLLPGADITLQKATDPARKTAYDLISVYKEGLQWVNIDSQVTNLLMKRSLLQMEYDFVKPEYKYGNSRVDFYMEKGSEKTLREVKGCTLATDLTEGLGMFPDAPTERGVKHVKELAAAVREGFRCEIAYVIQMNGIRRVLPNDATQPEFGLALREAAKAGVHILNFQCEVEANRIDLVDVLDDTKWYL